MLLQIFTIRILLQLQHLFPGMKWHGKDLWFAFQISTICILWWGASSAMSIVNKIVLQSYPYPVTIALSSCLNNVLYAIPLIRLFRITAVSLPTGYLLRTVVPIAIGRAAAITSAYFALWKVSVSYAQTVKATMPIFTVLISRLLLGERQSAKIYASLFPIIIGVFIATATELQFDTLGLCSSLLSTGIFAFLNVLAKKVFEETGMHPINLLAMNSQLASVFLFPFWVFTDANKMWFNVNSANLSRQQQSPDLHFLLLLCFSGLCSFFQNLCAFLLIHQLSTLSYAVTNTAKRILVIILSLLTLRNPVTPLNVCGMLLSTFGVFIYNRIKNGEKAGSDYLPVRKEDNNVEQQQQQPQLVLFRRREPLHMSTMHSSPSDVRVLLTA